jgi:hypothetical protein
MVNLWVSLISFKVLPIFFFVKKECPYHLSCKINTSKLSEIMNYAPNIAKIIKLSTHFANVREMVFTQFMYT